MLLGSLRRPYPLPIASRLAVEITAIQSEDEIGGPKPHLSAITNRITPLQVCPPRPVNRFRAIYCPVAVPTVRVPLAFGVRLSTWPKWPFRIYVSIQRPFPPGLTGEGHPGARGEDATEHCCVRAPPCSSRPREPCKAHVAAAHVPPDFSRLFLAGGFELDASSGGFESDRSRWDQPRPPNSGQPRHVKI